MSSQKSTGLGRGLGALLDIDLPNDIISTNSNNPYIIELPLSSIYANEKQPRTIFDTTLIEELAVSIEVLGLIQPITVRKEADGRYKIISGERRFRASKVAGLAKIPAYVRTVNDDQVFELALVENIQREDLNAMEIADGLNKLIEECNITHDSLSKRIGKNRSTITNYIRLTKLPPEAQLALKNNLISMGHARSLLSIESVKKQIAVLKKIIKGGLSVRQVEKIAKDLNCPKVVEKKVDEEYPETYIRLVENLERFFNQNISIKRVNNNGAGKIVIEYKDDSEIENILKKFEKIND